MGAVYDKPYVASLKSKIKKPGWKTVSASAEQRKHERCLGKTDIFAFPSHHEGFPLALTEAMSCGIPAVGYASCPAVNELISDGETGILCDDGAEALAEALRRLMEDSELRRQYGMAARMAMEAYRPDVVWDQWETLMEKLRQKKVK